MAAAEARTVLQRTANRCFMQEDAKRAPKLACCQQSSSSAKQVDGSGPTSAAEMPDHTPTGFKPLNRNPSYSSLPPDTRWWLQLQPSYGYQKGFTYEELNAIEAEVENLKAGILSSPSKNIDDKDKFVDCNKDSESSVDVHCRFSADYMKKDPEVNKHEMIEALLNEDNKEFIRLNEAKESFKMMEMDAIGCPQKQKGNESSFDPESPWTVGEKNVPWWRTTDKDDLASLVAQKSLDYVENCDLPPPQKMHIRRYPNVRPGFSGLSSDKLVSYWDWKAESDCLPKPIIHAQGTESSEGSQRGSIERYSQSGSDKSFSSAASRKDTSEIGQAPKHDPCKAQLLEALRHSQTRAREAEKVAKQACAEKEHIVKLFFRQASQLFAYKQWFQLLQLESLYYQMKNIDQPMSTLFPVALPWMPQKGKKPRKNWQKSTKGTRSKRSRPKHDFGKYAVAFALGLSLVGAGLLLGWTVGWMLPF